MCIPASLVLTKDAVYWSSFSDSHEDIIEEYKLPEQYLPCFVRVEITPPNLDFTLPFEQWVYKTDQDLLPDWYVPEVDEKRARTALPEWKKANVLLPGEKLTKMSGKDYLAACYGEVKTMCDHSKIYFFMQNAKVEVMWDDSKVEEMWGNSRVREMREKSEVEKMLDKSKVEEMWDDNAAIQTKENKK